MWTVESQAWIIFFIQRSIVMGIGAMKEDDLDLSDSSGVHV